MDLKNYSKITIKIEKFHERFKEKNLPKKFHETLIVLATPLGSH